MIFLHNHVQAATESTVTHMSVISPSPSNSQSHLWWLWFSFPRPSFPGQKAAHTVQCFFYVLFSTGSLYLLLIYIHSVNIQIAISSAGKKNTCLNSLAQSFVWICLRAKLHSAAFAANCSQRKAAFRCLNYQARQKVFPWPQEWAECRVFIYIFMMSYCHRRYLHLAGENTIYHSDFNFHLTSNNQRPK